MAIPRPKKRPKSLHPQRAKVIRINEILMIQGLIIIILLLIIAFTLQKPYVIVV